MAHMGLKTKVFVRCYLRQLKYETIQMENVYNIQ